jgi:hypothetical protein
MEAGQSMPCSRAGNGHRYQHAAYRRSAVRAVLYLAAGSPGRMLWIVLHAQMQVTPWKRKLAGTPITGARQKRMATKSSRETVRPSLAPRARR